MSNWLCVTSGDNRTLWFRASEVVAFEEVPSSPESRRQYFPGVLEWVAALVHVAGMAHPIAVSADELAALKEELRRAA